MSGPRLCEECPLLPVKRFVKIDEVPGARILLLGDYPKPVIHRKNYWETREGQLVRSVLMYHNITEPVQYLPAIACVPPSDTSAANLAKAASCCSGQFVDYLLNQFDVIVTMGNSALKAITGKTGINKMRIGKPKSYGGKAKVIHTVSPSACFVNESQYPHFVTDIGKIYAPSEDFGEVDYEVITEQSEAIKYLQQIRPGDDLTIDIETATEKDLSFEHPERYDMLCIGLKVNDDKVRVLAGKALWGQTYKVLAEKMSITNNILHNAKFDLGGLRPLVGKQSVSFDTMLASYVLDERRGIHSLKYLAQEYLGAPSWESEVSDFVGGSKNFNNVPSDILHKYNAYDVEATYRLKKFFEQKLSKSESDIKHFNLLIDASNMLGDVEHNGFAVDVIHVKKTQLKMLDELREMDQNLVNHVVNSCGGPLDQKVGFNPRSPKQILRAFELMGVKITSSSKTMLDEIVGYGDEMPEAARETARLMLEYRALQKIYSTYVTGIAEREYKGRIHPSFILHGTTTGRLSCANPNMQNIPRTSVVKEFFVPSPGMLLIHADYSQAELRVLSWLAGDEYFRAILNDSTRDVFDELVPEIFPGVYRHNTDPVEFKEKRTMVKTYVYGLSYGRTEHGIAKGFGIPVEVARDHMKKFFAVIPEIISWQNRIREGAKKYQILETPNGRKRRFNLVTRDNENSVMNESLAFLPQSIASDMTLKAAINLNNDPQFTAKIVNLVHDDIIAESPAEEAEENLERIKKAMIDSSQEIVKGYINFEADGSIADRWSKL